MADLEKLVKALENSNGQGTGDTQGTSASSYPTPYSTDSIPPGVQNDPVSQFSSEDLDHMQNFSASPMMSSAYRVSTDDSNTGDDHGAIINTDSRGGSDLRSAEDGVVRDHRPVPESGSSASGPIVRDHRHPPVSLPPAAPPPGWNPPAASAPPSGTISTSFTSASDYGKLNQLNDNLEQAKQAALDDPTNPAKQLAFQEAAQALQLLFNLLEQLSSMKASMADGAIKAMKVNAA